MSWSICKKNTIALIELKINSLRKRKNSIKIEMEQDYIKNVAGELICSLSEIKDHGIKNNFSFDINCEALKDFINIDIRDSDEFRAIFEKLKELNGPVLYWFEILSDTCRENIRNQIINYSNSENSKATPALKKAFFKNSNCLYVGKVKKGCLGKNDSTSWFL